MRRQILYTNGVVGGKTTQVCEIYKSELVGAQVKSKARIVFTIEFQSSFRHSRITFFKKL